ncbi:MAG: hypothetical protein LQ348_001196 [Seirophora lacunosa]|nr:MAG: hypothetical protein LQ348_001196 [Seirophora lacunosa]
MEKVHEIAAQFDYSDDEVRTCLGKFLQQMVDLGGTNLRVCLVELRGDTSYHAAQTKTLIPPALMVSREGTELFDLIAEQVETLIRTHRPDRLNGVENADVFSLGLTFSFPVYQSAINSGILLRWTKGFDIPGVIGQDVCELLQQQIDMRNLPVKVTALVNDAAGAIMSRAYSLPAGQPRTSIGIIFGTGTNGVYLEKVSNIKKALGGHFNDSTREMLVSIEWGSFDNDLSVLPNTEYDVEVDQASINPGDQMFEKRVSGMFLGEILRTVLARLQYDPAVRLFGGSGSSMSSESQDVIPLYRCWAVDSSILSIAELDNTEDLRMLRQKIVDSLGLSSLLVGVDDAQVVKAIAHAIGKRAARLGGMALGAVVVKTEQLANVKSFMENARYPRTDRDAQLQQGEVASQVTEGDIAQRPVEVTRSDERCLVDVAVDGSVIEFYPRFEVYMREALRAVEEIGAEGEKRIRMGLAKDGSSVGAAIIALGAAQQV